MFSKLKAMRDQQPNEILNSTSLSFKKIQEQQLKMHELQTQSSSSSSFKMNDLIATENKKKKSVDYKLAESGKLIFTDKGDRIHFAEKAPCESSILLGLEFAAEKFGTIELKGTSEFKDQLLQLAVKNNIRVIFNPAELQEKFIELKSKVTIPTEKAPTTTEKATTKEKAPTTTTEKAPKEKAPKEKAPKEKAPKEKAPTTTTEKAPKEKALKDPETVNKIKKSNEPEPELNIPAKKVTRSRRL